MVHWGTKRLLTICRFKGFSCTRTVYPSIYHFDSMKLVRLKKINRSDNAQPAISTAGQSTHNTSSHTSSRMLPVDKFNQIHRCLSWWDQNVSGITAIYGIYACEEHAEHSVRLLSEASCQWRNAGCSLSWEIGQVERTMSVLWSSSHCCQTNDGLIDMGFWEMMHIFLGWSCKSGGRLYQQSPC